MPTGTVKTENWFLASCREATGVGHRDAQVLVGIYRSVIDTNFVVKVRPGRTSAQANVANGIAAMHLLTYRYSKIR